MECRCAACGRAFRPRSQVQEQRYCELPACQRERRRRWKWSKRHSDEDYRQNQALAQRAWAESHADYWCNYRLAHADYVERNPTGMAASLAAPTLATGPPATALTGPDLHRLDRTSFGWRLRKSRLV
jgi:hypothetical protein